jgi:hypothetical protein
MRPFAPVIGEMEAQTAQRDSPRHDQADVAEAGFRPDPLDVTVFREDLALVGTRHQNEIPRLFTHFDALFTREAA